MQNDGYAVMVGGPHDGEHIYVGHCRPERPRKIDFEVGETGGVWVARYLRCTRFQFDAWRSGGCGHRGQVTYRFEGYIAQEMVS